MTVKRAANLLKAQTKIVEFKHITKILGLKRVNLGLVESILLTSPHQNVLERTAGFLRFKAMQGNNSAFQILKKAVDEKVNQNPMSRFCSMMELMDMVYYEGIELLPSFVLGANDSYYRVRMASARGLRDLARKGVKETVSSLFKLANDQYLDARKIASEGNLLLAKQGVKEAMPGLIVALIDSNHGTQVGKEAHTNGKEGLNALTNLGVNVFPTLVKVYKNKKARRDEKMRILDFIQTHVREKNTNAIKAYDGVRQ